MRSLYQARDRIQAQMLHDFLDRHLIESVVLGDYLSGAVGELPANIYPTLWVVHDEDFDRGRELLASFLASERLEISGPPWTCAVCGEHVDGELDVCWSCSSPRPESE